jgi:hypothetical protein
MKIIFTEPLYSEDIKKVLHKFPRNLILTVNLGYLIVLFFAMSFITLFKYPIIMKTRAKVWGTAQLLDSQAKIRHLQGRIYLSEAILSELKSGTDVILKYDDINSQKTVFIHCRIRPLSFSVSVAGQRFAELDIPGSKEEMEYFSGKDTSEVSADVIVGKRNIFEQLSKQFFMHYRPVNGNL